MLAEFLYPLRVVTKGYPKVTAAREKAEVGHGGVGQDVGEHLVLLL